MPSKKCATPGCTAILVSGRQQSLDQRHFCGQCKEASEADRARGLPKPTAEQIVDAQILALEGKLAEARKRKAALPVEVPADELAALRKCAEEHFDLLNVLKGQCAAFRPCIKREELIPAFTQYLSEHPEMLRGRRI